MSLKFKRSLVPLFVILLLTTSLYRCSEDVPSFPILSLQIGNISSDGAEVTFVSDNFSLESAVSFGIIWSENQHANLSNGLVQNLALNDVLNGSVKTQLNTLKRSTRYWAKAFIQTESNVFYSEEVVFLSQGSTPPQIESITPSQGTFGDTLLMIVRNFGIDSLANEVRFNEATANIISRNDSLWQIEVPKLAASDPFYDTGVMEVFVTKYNVESQGYPFDLLSFDIINNLPESAKSGDEISLAGSGLIPTLTSVFYGSEELVITEATESSLKFNMSPTFESRIDIITVRVGAVTLDIGEIEVIAPSFTTSQFTDVIGAGIDYSVSGENLDNQQLEILIDGEPVEITSRQPQRLDFIVTPALCADQITVEARIDTNPITLAENLPVAKTSITGLTIDQADYSEEFEVSFQHFPSGQQLRAYINGIRTIHSGSTGVNKGRLTLTYEIPDEVIPEDGWLNFQLDLCDQSIVRNQFAFIDKPRIETLGTINPYQTSTIAGTGLGGVNRKLFINGVEGGSILSSYGTDKNRQLRFVLGDRANGTYDIHVEINGQTSERFSVAVTNLWEKVADLQDEVSLITGSFSHPVSFLNGDVLYVGGGFSNATHFYSYNLTTGVWEKKADLPISLGTSANDDTHGYLFYNTEFYRYDFASDSWDQLTSLLDVSVTNFITGYSSFVAERKFFLSTYCLNLYYYDLDTGLWNTVRDSGADPCTSTQTFTTSSGNIYIHHYSDFVGFDPVNLSYSDGWFRGYWNYGFANNSLQGFEYNNELYLLDDHKLRSINITTRDRRDKNAPFYITNPKLFLYGDEALMVHGSEIWKYFLTK